MSKFIEQAELHATKTITNKFSNKLVYHEMGLQQRIAEGAAEIAKAENLNEEETELVMMGAWLSQLGFQDIDKIEGIEDPRLLFKTCQECTVQYASKFLDSVEYPEERKVKLVELLRNSAVNSGVDTKLSNVLEDAITIDWSKPKAKKKIKKLYEELLLIKAVNVGTSGFLDRSIDFISGHRYKTPYGQKVLEPAKQSLILKLEKERKDISKNEKLVIKQELGISESELKQLSKNLKSVKGRDERGIQTMFRTTSRNHYTLNQMVDRKANIMISINAIILSVILSNVVGVINTWCIHNSPVLVMLVSSALSIGFAVIAILPSRSHGTFTEEAVRNKEGNLLYFGNYHNMVFKDYKWGMLQMLSDSNYLYNSMIRDQYFLGQMLSRKYKHIRISLAIFLIGFIVAVISFMLVRTLPDFHFGTPHIG